MDTKKMIVLVGLISFLEDERKLKILFLLSEDEKLTFADLRARTGLNTNNLNHRLIELRKNNIVFLHSGEYVLTKLGVNLYQLLKIIEKDPAAASIIEINNAISKALCPKQ